MFVTTLLYVDGSGVEKQHEDKVIVRKLINERVGYDGINNY